MKQLLYTTLWLFVFSPVWAQSGVEADYSVQKEYLNSAIEKNELNKKTWQKATKGLDYTPKKPRRRRSGAAPAGKMGGNGRVALTIILIVFVGLLLAFAIAYAMGWVDTGKREKNNKNISIEDVENNIFETDLEALIQQALNQKDFKLAIRLYFLSILKELSLQKKIKWKKDKTNRAYASELSATPFHLPFQKLAVIFDRVRYGGNDLNQIQFQEVEPDFTTFIRDLNPQLLSAN